MKLVLPLEILVYNLKKLIKSSNRQSLIVWACLFILLNSCGNVETEKKNTSELLIIPSPSKVLKRSGSVTFGQHFWVIADVSDSPTAKLANELVSGLESIPGTAVYIADLYSTRKHEQSIKLELVEGVGETSQSYTLSITSKQVIIQSSSPIGLQYGIQSFLQVLSGSWNESSKSASIQKMVIKDEPIFTHREIRVASSISDEDLAALIKSMQVLKLNGLSINGDVVISENILKLAKDSNINISRYSIPDPSDYKPINLKKLIEAKELNQLNIKNYSDRIEFSISKESTAQISIEILVAGQIGWSGKGIEDYSLLLKHQKLLTKD